MAEPEGITLGELFDKLRESLLGVVCPRRRDRPAHEPKFGAGVGSGGDEGAKAEADADEDPYEVLGVAPQATLQEVKQAYRRLALLHHPDKNNGNPDSARMFVRVNRAYERVLVERESSSSRDRDTESTDEEDDGEQTRKASWAASERDVAEQFRRFEEERRRYRRHLSKRKKRSAASNPAGREIPDEPFAEFALSRHDLAIAIRSRYSYVLSGFLLKGALDGDIGRGSTPLHFAAYFANEDAAMAVMRFAGREWFRLFETTNDDGLSVVDIALKFQPEAKLTEQLLTWTEQAVEARSLYLVGQGRTLAWSNIFCIAVVLGVLFWFGVGRSILTSLIILSLTPLRSLATRGLLGFVVLFLGVTLLCYLLQMIWGWASSGLDVRAWDILWACAVVVLDTFSGACQDVLDSREDSHRRATSESSRRRSPLLEPLQGWMLLHLIFEVVLWLADSSVLAWIVSAVFIFFMMSRYEESGGWLLVFIVFVVYPWLKVLYLPQLAVFTIILTSINTMEPCNCPKRAYAARRARFTRRLRSWCPCASRTPHCEALVLRGQEARKGDSSARISGQSDGGAAQNNDGGKDAPRKEKEEQQRRELLEAHRRRIQIVEARQTRQGQQHVKEQLQKAQAAAENEEKRLRQQEDAAKAAERSRREQRRAEEERWRGLRETARADLEAALRADDVARLRVVLAAARRANLGDFGHGSLVAEAERRVQAQERAEAAERRRVAEASAAALRVKAEAAEKAKLEERRLADEKERRRKEEDRRRKEEEQRRKREDERQRKEEERRRKADELQRKKAEEQRKQEEEKRRKEKVREQWLAEKERQRLEHARWLAEKERKCKEEEEAEARRRGLRAKGSAEVPAEGGSGRREGSARPPGRIREAPTQRDAAKVSKRPGRYGATEPAPEPPPLPPLQPPRPLKVEDPPWPPPPPPPPRRPIVALPPAPPPHPRAGGNCSPPETAEVIASYSCPNDGYLAAEPELWVLVHFWQGPDEYEAGGWAFACVVGQDARRGWLPQRVLRVGA